MSMAIRRHKIDLIVMESLAESLSAAEGGAISTTVLYPLEGEP